MLSAILKAWLPVAALITLICGIIYIVVQQNYRGNANDPQIQMAEDAFHVISQGIDPASLVGTSHTEISRSLKPYLIFYDERGVPVTGDGVLDGKFPAMPAGVFDFTKQYGEDRITWQPRAGVRSALDILYMPEHGFVVAGRSLRMIEEREQMLTTDIFIGWVVSLGAMMVLLGLMRIAWK